MSRLRRHKHRQEPTELNVTAFLNLMVVLVPFLLISAVFSQMAVLELNMPDSQQEQPEPKDEPDEPKEKVQVILRDGRLLVNNGQEIALELNADESGEYPIEQLTEYLMEAKERLPDTQSATVLLESDIEYQRLIAAMDALREKVWEEDGEIHRKPLFPAVSIGQAPPEEGGDS
ncbi:MAG: ExbD/TolR family protein [Pseudomonadota bacterium]